MLNTFRNKYGEFEKNALFLPSRQRRHNTKYLIMGNVVNANLEKW